jgi:hypothetical protein
MAWHSGENKGMRYLIPALVILMLFVSMAAARSVRGDVPQGLMTQSSRLEKSVRLPDRPAAAGHPDLKFSMNGVAEPTAFNRCQTTSLSPLPAASVLALQANPGKYLDHWPTPGTTVTRDEPPDEELVDDDLM